MPPQCHPRRASLGFTSLTWGHDVPHTVLYVEVWTFDSRHLLYSCRCPCLLPSPPSLPVCPARRTAALACPMYVGPHRTGGIVTVLARHHTRAPVRVT